MANQSLTQNVSDVLISKGIVTPSDITKAQQIAGENKAYLEDAIFSLGIGREEDMVKAIGEVYGLPYASLSGKKVPFVVLSKFPEDVAIKYNMVVFEITDDQTLKVGLARPWDPVTKKALDFISKGNHLNIEPYIVSVKGLNEIIEQYKSPIMVEKETGMETAPKADLASGILKKIEKKPEEKATDEVDFSRIAELVKEDLKTKEQLEEIIKNSAVPRIVAALIKYGVAIKASDIHIEPLEGADTRIRYRIDGILNQVATIARKDHAALVSRIKILAKLKIDEQRVPQDGRIDVVFGKKEIDLRISTFPTINGEKVVMRILDKSGGLITIEDLGLTGKSYDNFLEAIQIPHGILLVTGPTGSGKSTTLYAAISRINKEGVNIVTLEDPVEYQMVGVNQSQVKPYIGYTFANGLRSILRQDPNIIMVGEIRDRETAEMAIQSALTGHLVFSTLHTNDAAGAIPRLIDMGVEPFLIASSLHTIVGQRLVRKLCPDCKKLVEIPAAVYDDMKEEYDKIPEHYRQGLELKIEDKKMYESVGCANCGGGGYKGRFGVYELLRVSEEIQRLCIARASATDILNQGLKEGMITMKQDGIIKVLKGMTTMEEVYRVTTL
ncbi:MAG TPA: ATPase, T2SS/T4P/T4SS family [Patescibacteria group bacterium]|nr:ATPase, T2SS/T4P/T4SS family [Patescibacteria group bacterium]